MRLMRIIRSNWARSMILASAGFVFVSGRAYAQDLNDVTDYLKLEGEYGVVLDIPKGSGISHIGSHSLKPKKGDLGLEYRIVFKGIDHTEKITVLKGGSPVCSCDLDEMETSPSYTRCKELIVNIYKDLKKRH